MNKTDYLDYLKVFSLLFISFYFVSDIGFSVQNNHLLTYHLIKLISSLAFPCFLMVFGVCIFNKHLNWLNCVKETYYYLIPPFIFWNIILAIIIVFFNGLNSFVSNILTPNWFIWILLSNVLIIPVLNEFIKWEKENGIKYILVLFILTSILWSLSVQFSFSLYYIDLVFFAQPVCFMLLGYYLNNHDFKISSKKLFILSFVLLFLILITRSLFVIKGINDWDSYFIPLFKNLIPISVDPFTIIEVSCIFLMFKSINCILVDNKLINFYSRISFNYLLLLSVLVVIFYNLNFNSNLVAITLFGSILIFIIIGIFLVLLQKIPFVKLLFKV